MAMRTSSPHSWSPDWGQGEEGPRAGRGPKRDIRGLAPCQPLGPREQRTEKLFPPNREGSSQATHPPLGPCWGELPMLSPTPLGPGGLSKARTPIPFPGMGGSGLRLVLLCGLGTWLFLPGPVYL